MDRLYAYLIYPERTLQLHSHQKDWRLWWILVGINAVISIIKVSSLGVFSLLFHGVLWLGWLIITAIIIDASAQLMGQKGQLPTVLYWLGFANTILWLSPSAAIIQHAFYSIGSIIAFGLNMVFLYYIWLTIQKIYNLNKWRLMGVFMIPCVSVFAFIISLSVVVTQMAMVIK